MVTRSVSEGAVLTAFADSLRPLWAHESSARSALSMSLVLPIPDVDDRRIQRRFVENPTDAAALGPPILSILIESIPKAASRGYHNVHMIRATVSRKEMPFTNVTRFFELRLNGRSHLAIQPTRVVGHPGSGFQLTPGQWQSPASAIFNPSARVAGQPGAVGIPSQKQCDRVVHQHSPPNDCPLRGENTHGALGYPQTAPSLTLRVTILSALRMQNARD